MTYIDSKTPPFLIMHGNGRCGCAEQWFGSNTVRTTKK